MALEGSQMPSRTLLRWIAQASAACSSAVVTMALARPYAREWTHLHLLGS